MNIYGILAVESRDHTNEILRPAGLQLDGALPRLWWEGGTILIGSVSELKVISDPDILPADEYESHVDYELARRASFHSFVKIRAEISEYHNTHGPLVASILRDGSTLFFGAVGKVLERKNDVVEKWTLNQVWITTHGVHDAYRVLEGDGV